MHLKSSLLLATALILAAPAHAEHPTAGAEHPSAKSERNARVLAVVFHADWCPNCKDLAPKLAAAESEFKGSVEFVRLDLTNDETKKSAEQTADQLGLGELYRANAGKTGLVVLTDRESGKTLQQITSAMDANAIRAAMKSAIAGKPGTEHPKKEHPAGEHPKPSKPKSEHPSSEHPR